MIHHRIKKNKNYPLFGYDKELGNCLLLFVRKILDREGRTGATQLQLVAETP